MAVPLVVSGISKSIVRIIFFISLWIRTLSTYKPLLWRVRPLWRVEGETGGWEGSHSAKMLSVFRLLFVSMPFNYLGIQVPCEKVGLGLV